MLVFTVTTDKLGQALGTYGIIVALLILMLLLIIKVILTIKSKLAEKSKLEKILSRHAVCPKSAAAQQSLDAEESCIPSRTGFYSSASICKEKQNKFEGSLANRFEGGLANRFEGSLANRFEKAGGKRAAQLKARITGRELNIIAMLATERLIDSCRLQEAANLAEQERRRNEAEKLIKKLTESQANSTLHIKLTDQPPPKRGRGRPRKATN